LVPAAELDGEKREEKGVRTLRKSKATTMKRKRGLPAVRAKKGSGDEKKEKKYEMKEEKKNRRRPEAQKSKCRSGGCRMERKEREGFGENS